MQDRERDWVQWHRDYDDPSSSLSRRLSVVQDHLRRAVDARPGRLRMISMCAGEGRDVIAVLAAHPRQPEIAARLVELDERNVAVAREAAQAAGLERVEVVQEDAALTGSYAGAVPADIVLACGIFGNIPDTNVRRIIEHLPSLCAPGATVIWTRGREPDRDVALDIRDWFVQGGFEEVAFDAPSRRPLSRRQPYAGRTPATVRARRPPLPLLPLKRGHVRNLSWTVARSPVSVISRCSARQQ